MDETDYLSRINGADRKLLATARLLRPGTGGEIHLDETRAWPGELATLLSKSSAADLLRLQFVTERYYARRLRYATDDMLQDELLALAYLRVVHLQFLRREPDMGFTERELHFVLAAIRHYRADEGREPAVLEIGCGAGSLLESLAEAGFRSITGVDLAPAAIDAARKRLAAYGLAQRVQRTTATRLLLSGHAGAFDVVLLCDVIEHIPPGWVQSFIDDVRKLLRIRGMLIAVTPNAFAGPHDITRYFRPPGSEPEGLHLHEYSLRELTSLLSGAGFECFMGTGIMHCIPWARKPQLNLFSTEIRLAAERLFPYVPQKVARWAVDLLYFSALCARSAGD